MTIEEAAALLRQTSTNNATGIIGGPYSVVGYTLSGALSLLQRCTGPHLGRYHGHDVLVAYLAGHGDHIWYLNPRSRTEDPWA